MKADQGPPTAIPIEQTLDGHLKLELIERSEREVKAKAPVHDGVRQPLGIVHGGTYASIAETMASMGTYMVVYEQGKIAVGISNSTNFLRPISEGTIHAVARARHAGRTTWVWDTDFTDDAGRLCATSRVTIAVREPSQIGSAPSSSR